MRVKRMCTFYFISFLHKNLLIFIILSNLIAARKWKYNWKLAFSTLTNSRFLLTLPECPLVIRSRRRKVHEQCRLTPRAAPFQPWTINQTLLSALIHSFRPVMCVRWPAIPSDMKRNTAAITASSCELLWQFHINHIWKGQRPFCNKVNFSSVLGWNGDMLGKEKMSNLFLCCSLWADH